MAKCRNKCKITRLCANHKVIQKQVPPISKQHNNQMQLVQLVTNPELTKFVTHILKKSYPYLKARKCITDIRTRIWISRGDQRPGHKKRDEYPKSCHFSHCYSVLTVTARNKQVTCNYCYCCFSNVDDH